MFKFLFYYGIQTSIIATKADKLPKSKISAYVQKIASKLGVGKDNIIPYSSETKMNRDKVLDIIENDIG
jgi:GTP-binding protein